MTTLVRHREILTFCLLFLATLVPVGAAEIEVPGDFGTIQEAIAAAEDGDEIVVSPGRYQGPVNPFGKAITIRSVDPENPTVVRQTVINGRGERAVTFFSGERIDTVLDGFTITGGVADQGGGIGIFSSDPTIRNSVIRGNSANQGGGIYAYYSSAHFENCTVRGNSAVDGGGLYTYATIYLRFDRCRFTGNFADSDGGAVSSTFSDTRFQSCVFAGNVAADRGGAFDSDNTSVRFVSSLIRDNSATLGGALAIVGDSPELLGTTVVRNDAVNGGAIYGIMSQPIIRNSIVRDNTPSEFGGVGNNPTAEFSNVTGGLSGPGNIDADPLFVDPANGNFRLAAGSPSADAGFNGWRPSYALRDLGGSQRIRNDIVDMGAYESPGPTFRVRSPSHLVVAMRDQGSLAFGLETPLLDYDPDTDRWRPIVRNLPAYAIASDPATSSFWIQSGENGLLGRIPWDTLELEEVAVMKFEGSPAQGLSGMAVVDGVLYASAWRVGQPSRLYAVDTKTATLSLVGDFAEEFEIWDLHYDPASDRMLALSSPEDIPPSSLGVFEVDLATLDLTEVQPYVNEDPAGELNLLQGLAEGDERRFVFRSTYNKLEIFDAPSQTLIDTISIPDFVDRPGQGWLWGGLAWVPPS